MAKKEELLRTVAMIFMVGRLKKQVDSRTWELEQMNEKLRLMATIDGLTGVMNRRCFDEMLDREWKQSLREKVPLTIVLIDVDYFKGCKIYQRNNFATFL